MGFWNSKKEVEDKKESLRDRLDSIKRIDKKEDKSADNLEVVVNGITISSDLDKETLEEIARVIGAKKVK